jgi:hypothetical protein
MSDDNKLPQVRSADVIEYTMSGPSPSVPTLPQAIAELARAFSEIGAVDDALMEYERDRYGAVKYRFRCYRHK